MLLSKGFQHRLFYFEIHYEDLCDNSKSDKVLFDLRKFLKIEDTAQFDKIRENAHQDALNRWKDYPIEDVKEVYNIIKDVRIKMGYKPIKELE